MKFHLALVSALALAAAPALAGETAPTQTVKTCNLSNQTGGDIMVMAGGTQSTVKAGMKGTVGEGGLQIKTAQDVKGQGTCVAGSNITVGLNDGKVVLKTE